MLVKLRMKASVKSTQLLMLRVLQTVQPCPSCALEHERDVLHSNTLVAVRYDDGRGVVDQPVLRLHGASVLGRISGKREPSREGLISDSGAKSVWTQCVFFF